MLKPAACYAAGCRFLVLPLMKTEGAGGERTEGQPVVKQPTVGQANFTGHGGRSLHGEDNGVSFTLPGGRDPAGRSDVEALGVGELRDKIRGDVCQLSRWGLKRMPASRWINQPLMSPQK